jgi:LuxR family maltose regulon positive regulatory protein
LTGDLGACRESALAAIGRGGPPSRWEPFAHTWLGASTFWLGDSGEGLDRLEQALERCRSAAQLPMEGKAVEGAAQVSTGGATAVACLGMLGLVHLMQGDFDRAQERADAALTLSAQAGLQEYWVNAAAHIARAGLLTHAGRAEAAAAELDRALEVARRGSGPVETIHALVARCLAARAEGDDDAARVHLGDAHSTLLSCPDPGPVVTSLVTAAEAGLPKVRGRIGQVFPVVEEFSDREIDVLRLLRGSLSQREIGDELFISFNTVKTHSKSIYRKLGVGRRTDAVARARELDLI